jgi:predicted transglutaminase-like cysteine proteinase
VLALAFLAKAGAAGAVCSPMDLPVLRLEPPPAQYADFCLRHPAECSLTGDPVLPGTPDVLGLLDRVNRQVNAELSFMSDPDCHGLEEWWSFPEDGFGDCEDYALEKRRRLVDAGLSSAALTMAILYHMDAFFLHAVLLAETADGTRVLDDLTDDVLCWDEPPYRWYLREGPHGNWMRFARPV